MIVRWIGRRAQVPTGWVAGLTSRGYRVVTVAGICLALALTTASSGVALGSFSDPRPIIPRAGFLDSQMLLQATDRQGDTTFVWLSDLGVQLRVLKADGSLTPIRTVDTVGFAISLVRLAVDDDGHGVVVWDDYQSVDDINISLYARRVTPDGRLGSVRRIAPSTHNVNDAQVAVAPDGRAIVTWLRLRIGQSSYIPWVRTFGVDSSMGRARQVGAGPNADAPRVGFDRSGRALLAWPNNSTVYVRRMSRSGSLSPTVRLFRDGAGTGVGPNAPAADRDGDALITWTRVHDTVRQTWGRRISRTMRPLGKARLISRRGQLAGSHDTDMDLQGDAVVAWTVGYHEGVFARHIDRDGAMGPVVRLGNGGITRVALDDDGDGAVAWGGFSDGVFKAIRVTRVRRGGTFGRTTTVGLNDADTSQITVDAAPRGRLTIAWPQTPSAGARIYVVRSR